MDIVSAVGLMLGLGGFVATIAFGLSQNNDTNVNLTQIGHYLEDLHSHMLTRFDRMEAILRESLEK